MSDKSTKRIFNHEELEAEIKKAQKENSSDNPVFKKSKHTLDSDEEDDEEAAMKYNVLDPNELEGQEEGTIDYDGEIKITPFNMREELEEGYFDKEGTYIFNKETEAVKDKWLDDIDWVKIKAREETKKESSDSDDDLPSVNLAEHYPKMLELMKPGETVRKAICRLGGSSSSSRNASSRWKKKKDRESEAMDEEAEKENYEKLQLLTRLADDIIQSGNMDIYEQSYEKLAFHVNVKSNGAKTEQRFESSDGLDMFGDDFEEKVDERSMNTLKGKADIPSPSAGNTNEDEVMWEFKWEASADSKIYGPFPTSQMFQWVTDKYFEDGVLVRQCGKQDSGFYSSKRIDFDLYL